MKNFTNGLQGYIINKWGTKVGRKLIDLVGKTFERLTVVEFVKKENGYAYWMCECQCGNKKIVSGDSLRNGGIKSCGCLNDEIRRSTKRYKNIEIGQRFGRLVVVSIDGIIDGSAYWLCKCDCGNIKSVFGTSLRNGSTSSCGCYGAEMRKGATYKDITGQRFGKLLVLKRVIGDKKHTLYLCKCDCGNEKIIDGRNLREGKSKSCGCYNVESHYREYGQASFTDLFLRYKNAAKKRELTFELDKILFKNLTSSTCFYCGQAPIVEHRRKVFENGYYIYNGIDRIDNSIGYTVENVVPCCKNCNKAKHTMSAEDFLYWAEKVYRFITEKNHDF